MGRRGPPPKPSALRVLSGNASKRSINKSEPKPPTGSVAPPSWLSGGSLDAWDQIAPIVEGMKVLTVADAHSLALGCDAYAEVVELRAYLRENGRVYESRHFQMDADGNTFERVIIRPRPEVSMMQDAWKRARAMFQEFGLTPSSRSRIKTGEPQAEEDPFEAWVKRGSSN
jgi:P27 family predicted phage terminase small subunit